MGRPGHSISFWTLGQYSSFIQYVEDIRARTAFQLLFFSGMRFGELLAFALEDCDFEENTISITKTFHAKKRRRRNGSSQNSEQHQVYFHAGDHHAGTPSIHGQDIRHSALRQDIYFHKSLIRGNIERCSQKAGIPRMGQSLARNAPYLLYLYAFWFCPVTTGFSYTFFHSPVSGDYCRLYMQRFPAFPYCFFYCIFYAAATGYFHPYYCDTLYIIFTKDFSQFF